MTNQWKDALSADRGALLEIAGQIDETDWSAPSGCAGWSLKDVVAHLGALFWMVVDPSRLPDTSGLPTEQAQEVFVKARRSLSPAEIVDDYASVSQQALVVLEHLSASDGELALGDMGTYPTAVLPTAFCFDHYTHIRADLYLPRGSLVGPAPASDELRVRPALDWVEAALPQQNHAILDELTGAVEIVVTGPGARSIHLGPQGSPTASVRGSADALVRWVTQRTQGRDVDIEMTGDEGSLDALRAIKVF